MAGDLCRMYANLYATSFSGARNSSFSMSDLFLDLLPFPVLPEGRDPVEELLLNHRGGRPGHEPLEVTDELEVFR